ncbi:hypothetical protein FU659_13755 [Paenibacillus sp. N3.4]|nr:hypothetical protein FU659_13755 [Paenibacillus sp. N3.4]
MNWNMFDEAEPDHFLEEDSPIRWSFTEDLLQLQKDNITVDLGWYPECSVEGNYLLVLIKNEDWANPFFCFESRRKAAIIHKIEKNLMSGA